MIRVGGGKNLGIVILKFLAALFITYSHMGILFPKYGGLVTGGAIGDGLFFFCSGFTLFLGRKDSFFNWYKRRISRIYPTIIMWALLSAVVFDWKWSVTDLIITPKYWFIPCIMIYYIIFFLIREYFMMYLNAVLILVSTIIIISNFLILDQTHSVMYADIPFMRIYYFSFMMLGAITALKKNRNNSTVKSITYAVISVIIYYVCMGIYKIDPFYCRFQILSIIPLLFTIYWIYQFCNTEKVYNILNKKICGRIVYYISCLTLEIYMVQYAIFTDKLNFMFPFNILVVYVLIFIAAYILKCFSNLFVQVFNDKPFNIKAIYTL